MVQKETWLKKKFFIELVSSMSRRISTFCLLFIVIVFLLFIDLWTKYLFFDLRFYEQLWLFTPSFNSGIAWSLPVPLLVILLISFLFVFLILILFFQCKIRFCMTVFLLSWTLWNLYDRILFFWVRDFIDFHFFPIFNCADVFLTIGIILFLYDEFFSTRIENR